MNAARIEWLIFVALICLVAQGCSFESKEEKQARAERETLKNNQQRTQSVPAATR